MGRKGLDLSNLKIYVFFCKQQGATEEFHQGINSVRFILYKKMNIAAAQTLHWEFQDWRWNRQTEVLTWMGDDSSLS
jgi:hypothetical protein